MTTPTQKQKQLAERIYNYCQSPVAPGTQRINSLAQLLADEGEKRREVLRRKVKQAKKHAQEWQSYLDELDGIE